MAGPNTATGAQPAGYDGAVAVPRAPSLPPGFSLRRCAPRDTARLVDVYTDAFTGGDFTYWWGPAAAMRAWNVERFRRRFRDPSEALFKVVVDGDGGDGGGGGERIVAHTRWVLPEGMAGKGLRVEPEGGGGVGEEVEMGEVGSGNEHPDVPEGVDVELYREFFDGVARAAEKWKASEKLELSLLCTDPAYHGRGIGAAAVRNGLEAADAEGVECFLAALPLAAPLYARLGFEAVDRIEFPLARARTGRDSILQVMIWKPKGRRD